MPEMATVLTTDAEIDAAIRQARTYEKYDRRALRAAYSERTDRLTLHMDNDVTHVIPRSLLQGLASASPGALNKIELLGSGTGLYWPALDVAHSVSGLLAGVYGSAKWMNRLRQKSRNGQASRKSSVSRFRNGANRLDEKAGNAPLSAIREKHGKVYSQKGSGRTRLTTLHEQTPSPLREQVIEPRRRKA